MLSTFFKHTSCQHLSFYYYWVFYLAVGGVKKTDTQNDKEPGGEVVEI